MIGWNLGEAWQWLTMKLSPEARRGSKAACAGQTSRNGKQLCCLMSGLGDFPMGIARVMQSGLSRLWIPQLCRYLDKKSNFFPKVRKKWIYSIPFKVHSIQLRIHSILFRIHSTALKIHSIPFCTLRNTCKIRDLLKTFQNLSKITRNHSKKFFKLTWSIIGFHRQSLEAYVDFYP